MTKLAKSRRQPLMAGNWKMNLNHLEAIALVQKVAFSLDSADLEAVEVAVLPPFTDIRSVQTLIDGDKLDMSVGAQDISAHDAGAYTGEVSGAFLAKLGCSYVTVGHSERREYHDETDDVVAAKIAAALRHEVTPIVCVGEKLDTRKADQHVEWTLAQLEGAFAHVKAEQAATMVIAYEPVWAIGTGEVATGEDAQEMAAAVRGWLERRYGSDTAEKTRILYGGSVKAANVKTIMEQTDIDGALVGGASIDAEEFALIVRYHRTHDITR